MDDRNTSIVRRWARTDEDRRCGSDIETADV